MLVPIFGNKNVEKIFFFLLMNEHCYGRQLSLVFDQSITPFQKALERLESGSIVVSFLEGKTRFYQFNPRYPFLKELKDFLVKAYEFIPQSQKNQYYERKIRKRPRRKGKPL